jgi:hypothetical protein
VACGIEQGLDPRAGTGCEGGEQLRAPFGPGARRRSLGPVEMVPMSNPPLPGIPAVLLAVAAKLGFQVLSRDLAGREIGAFSDSSGTRPFVIGAGAVPGGCVWALLDTGPMPKMAYLLTRTTYDALHGGSLAENGALVYQGVCYWIRANFDGVVELTPA